MEIVDRGDDSGEEPVQIAFAETREEAALIRGLLREEKIRSIAKQASLQGPSLGTGLLTRSSRRIYVRPEDAAAARTLIAETMVEDPAETEIPEPVNAAYLDEARGHKPRDYNVIGAYGRAWLIAIVVLGLVLVAFLLLHS
jgi:Putative prokaryotic signal transducing protein